MKTNDKLEPTVLIPGRVLPHSEVSAHPIVLFRCQIVPLKDVFSGKAFVKPHD